MRERKVLIVDDDISICRYIARVCKDSGYEAVMASSFAEFEEALRRHTFFLVMTDLQMPDCDGIECMRVLANGDYDVPVAILSGFDPRVLQTAEAFGRSVGLTIIDTLQKPVVVAAIRELLETAAARATGAPEEELQAAIDKREITIFYQPKVSFQTDNFGTVVGFEALARWLHPQRGLIAPNHFIPLAEATGKIADLTDIVMDIGIAQLRQWADAGETYSLAINISPLMLDDRTLADRIHRKVIEAGVDPARLTLEITESGAMADPTKTMEILTRLRLKGFKLSIDDFGTGHSSLVQLYNLPFSELKIDRSFVSGIDDRDDAKVIVKTLIDLAHNLSLQVCAEGVETIYEWLCLMDYGCDRIQGYFAGKPIAGGEIPEWLEDWGGRRTEILATRDRQEPQWAH
ncbi:MAG: EAL domain-containing response regulator [Woeseia sp.]